MRRRPPRSTQSRSSAASDVYKRQAEGDLCAICKDPRRDPGVVCVVEQLRDLVAIERTETFHGRYHVLLGALSPLDGVGEEHLTLAALAARVERGGITEVILATCLLYTSDAADELLCVDLGGRRIRKKKHTMKTQQED